MLSPYRVLDLTDHGALLCGQVLGDLGADVIVVEPPGGASLRHDRPFADGEAGPDSSLAWWGVNRNKRGITIDFKSVAGRDRLLALAKTSAILLESYAPGYLDGLGLGYAALAAVNALSKTRGCIIFTSSVSGAHAGFGGALYVAAKHAITGLTKQLSLELAPEVRVNAVAPGYVPTELRGLESLAQEKSTAGPKLEDLPLQVLGMPEDYAAAESR